MAKRRVRYAQNRVVVSGKAEKFTELENQLADTATRVAGTVVQALTLFNVPQLYIPNGGNSRRGMVNLEGETESFTYEQLYNRFKRETGADNRCLRAYPTTIEMVRAAAQAINAATEEKEEKFSVTHDHIMRQKSGGGPNPDDSPFDMPARTAVKPGVDIDPAAEFKAQEYWQTIGAHDRASWAHKGQGVTVVILDAAPDVKQVNPALVDFYIRMPGSQFDYDETDAPEPTYEEIREMGRIKPGPLERKGYEDIEPPVLKPYHGTLSASLVRELAPDAKIVLVEVLNDEGETTGSTLAEALDYIGFLHEKKASVNNEPIFGEKLVVNMSLGIERSLAEEAEAVYLLEACDRLCSKGAVIVAAAGNDSFYLHPRSPEEPAAYGVYADTEHTYRQVIAVSAMGYVAGETALYSNRGNFAAPGMDILMDTGDDNNPANSRYIYWVGTSFAAPLVAGSAAVLLSAGVKPEEVKQTTWEGVTAPKNWNHVPVLNIGESLKHA
jgi:hypothetical protein